LLLLLMLLFILVFLLFFLHISFTPHCLQCFILLFSLNIPLVHLISPMYHLYVSFSFITSILSDFYTYVFSPSNVFQITSGGSWLFRHIPCAR
jgi:hypothetical protein